MELDAVTENRVHNPINSHECAPKKLVVVKGDVHTVRRHVSRDGAKEGHRGSRCTKGCTDREGRAARERGVTEEEGAGGRRDRAEEGEGDGRHVG